MTTKPELTRVILLKGKDGYIDMTMIDDGDLKSNMKRIKNLHYFEQWMEIKAIEGWSDIPKDVLPVEGGRYTVSWGGGQPVHCIFRDGAFRGIATDLRISPVYGWEEIDKTEAR